MKVDLYSFVFGVYDDDASLDVDGDALGAIEALLWGAFGPYVESLGHLLVDDEEAVDVEVGHADLAAAVEADPPRVVEVLGGNRLLEPVVADVIPFEIEKLK